MKLYDISKEVFAAPVFPGDPVPAGRPFRRMAQGGSCNLSVVELGTHSATHLDAPWHFVPGGKTIDQVDLARCIGPCRVVEAAGELDEAWAASQLAGGTQRLLIKGEAQLTPGAARLLGEKLLLVGVEAMSVAPMGDAAPVHRALLEQETAVLESIDLRQVPEGEYFLMAQPLKLAGLDGSPVRAVLMAE